MDILISHERAITPVFWTDKFSETDNGWWTTLCFVWNVRSIDPPLKIAAFARSIGHSWVTWYCYARLVCNSIVHLDFDLLCCHLRYTELCVYCTDRCRESMLNRFKRRWFVDEKTVAIIALSVLAGAFIIVAVILLIMLLKQRTDNRGWLFVSSLFMPIICRSLINDHQWTALQLLIFTCGCWRSSCCF